MKVEIREPIWKDRSISIRKDKVVSAYAKREMIEVRILHTSYAGLVYEIKPAKIIANGKKWVVRGNVELLNFPIEWMKPISQETLKTK